ncbi:MAG: hypothetical protein Q9168_004659 [Polycauliona sp. 1 TL-2023]
MTSTCTVKTESAFSPNSHTWTLASDALSHTFDSNMRLLTFLVISTVTTVTTVTIANPATASTIETPPPQDNKDLTLVTHSINAMSTNPQPHPHHCLLPRQIHPIWVPKFEHVVLAVMPVFAFPLYYVLLFELYSYILDTILDAIASSPPNNQLVIEAGHLRWEFGYAMAKGNISGDIEATPLPKRFVEEYFKSRRDAVERGSASVYEMAWWWEMVDEERAREKVCCAGMRVVGKGMVVVPPNNRR